MEPEFTAVFNPLKPNGNYIYHLLYQSVILHSVYRIRIDGSFMSLDVNSAYFLKQR
jgi:hypothetical protein